MCECLECGATFAPKRATSCPDFCSAACKTAWHNRRKARGAELYDLVMAWRFERDRPDMLNLITRMASAYRDGDKAARAGRRSWKADAAIARIPHGYGTSGDKR